MLYCYSHMSRAPSKSHLDEMTPLDEMTLLDEMKINIYILFKIQGIKTRSHDVI